MYCIYIYIFTLPSPQIATLPPRSSMSLPIRHSVFFVALHGTGPGANSGHVTINHSDLRFNHQKLGLDHHGVLNDDLTSTRRIAATTMDML